MLQHFNELTHRATARRPIATTVTTTAPTMTTATSAMTMMATATTTTAITTLTTTTANSKFLVSSNAKKTWEGQNLRKGERERERERERESLCHAFWPHNVSKLRSLPSLTFQQHRLQQRWNKIPNPVGQKSDLVPEFKLPWVVKIESSLIFKISAIGCVDLITH